MKSSLLYLIVAKSAVLVGSFLIFRLLVFKLPQREQDLLALSIVYLNMMSAFGDFGFTELATREAGNDWNGFRTQMGRWLLTKGFVASIAFVIFIAFFSWSYSWHKATLLVPALLTGASRSFSDFADGIWIGLRKPEKVMAYGLLQTVVVFVVSWVIGSFFQTADSVIWSWAIFYTILGSYRYFELRKEKGGLVAYTKTNTNGAQEPLSQLALRAFPFGIIGLLASVTSFCPAIVLSTSSTDQGQLASVVAAQRLGAVAIALGVAFYSALYSHLANVNLREESELKSKLAPFVALLSSTGLCLLALVIGIGERWAELILGRNLPGVYHHAVIQFFAMPLILIAHVGGAFLPAFGMEVRKVKCVAGVALVAPAVSFLMINRFPVFGASIAFATILGLQSLVLLMFSYSLWKSLIPLNRIVYPTAVTLAVGLLFSVGTPGWISFVLLGVATIWILRPFSDRIFDLIVSRTQSP